MSTCGPDNAVVGAGGEDPSMGGTMAAQPAGDRKVYNNVVILFYAAVDHWFTVASTAVQKLPWKGRVSLAAASINLSC